jgi:hypothetical protein
LWWWAFRYCNFHCLVLFEAKAVTRNLRINVNIVDTLVREFIGLNLEQS